jgi:CspA family cold shock protein
MSRTLGRVKWFDNRKGFGFVNSLTDGSEVFVHHSGLKSATGVFRTLYPGEYIEFELTTDSASGRQFAVSVTGVQGGLLLCENTDTRLMVRRSRPFDSADAESSEYVSREETRPRGTGATRGKAGAGARGRGRA